MELEEIILSEVIHCSQIDGQVSYFITVSSHWVIEEGNLISIKKLFCLTTNGTRIT